MSKFKVPRVCAVCGELMGYAMFDWKPPGPTHGYHPLCARIMEMEVKVYHDPEFYDEYTVVIGDDVFTMSSDPLSPQGVNQYAGTKEETRGQRKGNRLKITDVPLEVIDAIKERVAGYDVDENPGRHDPHGFASDKFRRDPKARALQAVRFTIETVEELEEEGGDAGYLGGNEAYLADLEAALELLE